MADPKYVRLREGVSACADILGGSGFRITGNDVQEFPSKDNAEAQSFVKTKIREGVLEDASKAEFEEVKDTKEKLGKETGSPHQEARLLQESEEAAERQAKKRKPSKAEQEEEEEPAPNEEGG